MKKQKIIVYDCFGGLNNSIKKALDEKVYKIYTFDVVKNDNNIFLDMELLQKRESNINQIDINTFEIVRFRNNKDSKKEQIFLKKIENQLKKEYCNNNLILKIKYLNNKEICIIPKKLIQHIFSFFDVTKNLDKKMIELIQIKLTFSKNHDKLKKEII